MEKTALKCIKYACDYAEIVTTPNTQEELIALVTRLKNCPTCDNHSVVQTSWRTENATFGSVEH